MTKKLFLILICISCLLFFSTISSAEFIQKYAPSELSILDVILVESHQSGDMLTRKFKLKIQNNTNVSLYDVKFTLVRASDQVIIQESEVYLGTIDPGQAVTSRNSFSYTVYDSKIQAIPEAVFHWRVEYEDGLGQKAREALLIEKFR